MKEKLKQGDTELAVILGGLISNCNTSINKPFKVYRRKEWNKWMMDETLNEFMPEGALKRSTIK